MKTYPIVCPSCNGTGHINQTGSSNSTTKKCPACEGTGIVTCYEV
jgi:DnaJ-class molecular chaperone